MYLTPFLQHLRSEKRCSNHTVLAYEQDLLQFHHYLREHDLPEDPALIAAKQVRGWVVQLLEGEQAPATVRRKVSALKSWFKYWQREGVVLVNPMSQVSLPKLPKRLPVVVPGATMNGLAQEQWWSDDFRGWRDRLVLELLYHTGMRRGELLALTVAGVDLPQQQLRVLGKGNKERIIPFGAALGTLLERYLEQRNAQFGPAVPAALILTNKGQAAYARLIHHIVQHYLGLAGVTEQRSPHVLRHSFATHLADAGAPLQAIKELLGHANLAATQIYTHNSAERLRKVYAQAHPKGEQS